MFNTSDPSPRSDGKKFRNYGLGLGGLGVGYGGLKIGLAADKFKRSTPAHTVDKIKSAWQRLLKNKLKSQRLNSKSKLILFAKPGEMFKKYVPESTWNTDPDARKLKVAALKKTKPQIKQQYAYSPADHRALDVLSIKHTSERENAKAKGAPPEAMQSMAKRHAEERNKIRPPKGYIITKPGSDQRAMLKADLATNLGGEHTEYHKEKQKLLDTHAGERARYEGASDIVTASLSKKHKDELGKLRKSYLQEVSRRKGYARHQEVRRGNIRGLMADKLVERRQALQAIRKHVVGSLPAPLSTEKMAGIKKSAKAMPDIAIGEHSKSVKTGIAASHGEKAPFKLGGQVVPDLPKRLAETERDIRGAVSGEAGKLANRNSRLYDYLTKRAGSTIRKNKKAIGRKELTNQTRETVHNIFQPTAPSGIKREKAASNLGYSPEMIDKIHAHQNKTGIWKDTAAGEQSIRKKIIGEGRIFAPPTPTKISRYPYLKSLGKGSIIGAGVIGGTLLARNLINKRKKETQFSTIKFGKLDPLTKFRIDWRGRLQGLGVPQEADAVMNTVKHLHRAKLAARRKDIVAFIDSGKKAGILPHDVSPVKALNHMKMYRSQMAEGERTARHLSKVPQREMFQRGLNQGRNVETRKIFKEGQKEAGHIAARKIAINERTTAAAAEKKVATARKAGNRNTLVAAGSGVAIGSAAGYGTKKKKETRFSSRDKLSPATKAGLSAAASGGVLGSLPLLRKGVKFKTAAKSIAAGTALGAALGGGGTYIGTKILGKPKRGEGAPFTKRAALGGGILGAAGGITAGVLAHKAKFGRKALGKFATDWRPASWAQKSGVLGSAGIGGVVGGLLAAGHAADEGQQVDTLQALTKAKRKTHRMHQFDTFPKKRLTVAQDRYKKKIHEQERQRMESNVTRSALVGGALASALRKKASLGKTLAAGAGLGAVTEGAVIASNRRSKDAFGDRTYAAKRVEKLPYQLGGLAVLGVTARRLYRKTHKFAEKDDKFVIPFFNKNRWKNRSLPRRGEEIQTGAKRAAAFVEDIKAVRKGEPIVDTRGRPKTPEWKKPYAHKIYAGAGIVGVLAAGKLLASKSKAIRAIGGNAKDLVNKIPGVKKTTGFLKGVGSDTKQLMKSLDERAADKVQSAAAKKAEEELTAAESEKRRRAIHRATEQRIPLSAKGKMIRFAESVPNWDIRDQRGKSARIYAPGSQKRERRPKEWYEKKANQRHLWEGIAAATGASGVGGTALFYRSKNKPKPTSGPIIAVRAGEESLIHMPVQTSDKYLWARRLRKVPHKFSKLNQRLDQIVKFGSGLL